MCVVVPGRVTKDLVARTSAALPGRSKYNCRVSQAVDLARGDATAAAAGHGASLDLLHQTALGVASLAMTRGRNN